MTHLYYILIGCLVAICIGGLPAILAFGIDKFLIWSAKDGTVINFHTFKKDYFKYLVGGLALILAIAILYFVGMFVWKVILH